MNPEENNPMMSPGGGQPGVGAPMDFTGGAGLSVSDGLAQAQDSLTSAGMAANNGMSGAASLEQISASDPSATMARPDEPLIPASPVPGSIGSAMNGPMPMGDAGAMADSAMAAPAAPDVMNPALNADPLVQQANAQPAQDMNAPQMAGQPAMDAAPYNPFAAPSAMPEMAAPGMAEAPAAAPMAEQPVSDPNGGMQPVAPEVANPALAQDAAGAAAMPGASMGGAPVGFGQTSSTDVPMGSQPKTEKFSKSGGGSKTLTMILAVVAVLGVVAAVIFCVLWLGAKDSGKTVHVAPVTSEDPVTEPEDAQVKCSREIAGTELDGFNGGNEETTFEFTAGSLQTMSGIATYDFIDAGSAEGARGLFDTVIEAINSAYEGWETPSATADYEITDSTATVHVNANMAAVAVEEGSTLSVDLPKDEEGKYVLTRDEVVRHYTDNGYTCSE